ncbi:contractile injection system protein, VgrG/Pvc8 family [Streptomyces sp. NBC_00536]|uniref:phage late control D family protein n=1 Tax=Streptomyces sp. NBC_00536 TaxID=2975769 RepID=UPI002E80D59C|nr:contractile injection system protein, VgrG/Pvc8 family [Streptomyces sp. NBC_00536]WUC82733.1 contractile injection system protein, VgrG/Pvc8 family [Streptomyces sp. NBC_00536]
MTEPVVAAVSPVFEVGGALVRDLARDCVHLDVTEGTEGLRTLRAHFLAVGAGATGPPARLLHLDGSTIGLGSALKVALGPAARLRHVFDGVVSAIELVLGDGEPPQVLVHAEDALMRLRMSRRLRTYREVTDAGIAAAVAAEHGLGAETDAPGPRYDLVQQLNQSDLAFLRDRARLIQAELWASGRTLHFRPRGSRGTTAQTLVYGSELLSARFAADLAHQRSEIVVTGYDAERGEGIDERAGPETVEAETAGGRTGARLLTQTLGPSTSLRIREAALTAEEARAWARAEMLRRGRRFVTVAGTTHGSPDLVVGGRLTLRSVGAPFEGEGYHVTRIRHTFDPEHGFRTRFDAERSALNEVV